MPKVKHIKKARRALPQHGIQVGDSYYQWSRMVGGRGVKFYSKEYPKRQQLTGSELLARVYDIEDRVEALACGVFPDGIENPETLFDDVKSELEDIKAEIEALGEEQDEKYNNMPPGLQEGATGQLLQGRFESCSDWASEVDAVSDYLPEVDEDSSEEDIRAAWDQGCSDIADLVYQGE